MTGHRPADMFKPFFQAKRFVIFRQVIRQVAQQPLHIHFAQKGRRFAHANRALPKRFQDKTHLRKFVFAGQNSRGIAFAHFNDIRNEKRLARYTLPLHFLFHFLINKALMGSVLIDDNNTILRLRDNIGFM